MSALMIKDHETSVNSVTEQTCLLRAAGITKRVSDYFTLCDVCFDMYAGEVHVILGENGAGKTTIARILSGAIQPDEGEIFVSGKSVKIDSPIAAKSHGITVAHQNLIQFPAMSVAANLCLYLPAKYKGLISNHSEDSKARAIFRDLGVLTEVDPGIKASDLSAGQQRQLSIACILVQDSPIIVLDDPTSYLSDEYKRQIPEIIAILKERGKAILYICHRVNEAKRIADRITVLKDGRTTIFIDDRNQMTSSNLLIGMTGIIFRVKAKPGLPIENVSNNVEHELGYNRKTLLSKHTLYQQLVCPDDRPRLSSSQKGDILDRLIAPEREYRILCSDGSYKWVHEFTRAVLGQNGFVDSYDIGIIDIQKTEIAQEVMRKCEQKYESLIENVPDVVYSSLPDGLGSRIFLSDKWGKWTGQSTNEIYRDPLRWKEVVHHEDIGVIENAYSEAFNNGSDYQVGYRLVHKQNGGIRYVRDHGVAVKDEDGRIVRYDGLISDISELKNLERDLLKNRELLTKLVANAPIPILLFKDDESIAYANSAFEELTGFTTGEVLGSVFPYPWVKDSKYLSENIPSRREESCITKGGNQICLDISSVEILSTNHQRLRMEVWNDISKERQFIKNLRSYNKLVTIAQEEERKKISREIHDESIQHLFGLCTRMDTIMRAGIIPDNLYSDFESISDDLGLVIESLRSFCHELRPDIIDRLGLFAATEVFLQDTAKRYELVSQINTSGHIIDLPSDIQLSLFRIVQEAINNICKHSNATEINVDFNYTAKSIEVLIADNGVGFEVPTDLGNFAHHGKLGLLGMRERVHLIGGSMSVISNHGIGTTISVRVPTITGNG